MDEYVTAVYDGDGGNAVKGQVRFDVTVEQFGQGGGVDLVVSKIS
jgi:hypothetical protein